MRHSKKSRVGARNRRQLAIRTGFRAIDTANGMEAIHADVQSTRYARSFVLSGELETEAIDANLAGLISAVSLQRRP